MSALCHENDIAEDASREFILGEGTVRRSIFITRKDGRLTAYENSCPHTGAPLNWEGDRFLDLAKQRILCSIHGALFRIEDGHCLSGPCRGKNLTPVAIRLEDGFVHLA